MSKLQIEFKKLSREDLLELQEISRVTFFDTFSAANTSENMKLYVDTALSETTLSKELNEPASEFYFAKCNRKTIGYFKINSGHAQTELRENNGMELERIYVLKEYQGNRVGQALIDKAIDIALKRKMDYVWLGVWTKNVKAISFYERNNFVSIGSHPFLLGNDEQIDLIMKRDLR